VTGTQKQETSLRFDGLESRRSPLRRSVFGVTAIGLTGFLAACGDEGEEEPAVSGQGAEDPGEDPGIGEETGIGDGDGAIVEDEGN
jgi:hypothetical protein